MVSSVLGVLKPLLSTRERRDVLIALSAAYMLVQLSSLPVALSLPTLAEYFKTGIDDVAWMVIVYLMMLGALVMLMARLGDRYGHERIFFAGLVTATIGSVALTFSQDLWHLVTLRGVTGIGSAMIMGNANAILAYAFPPEERGRAFAVPIIGARFGTLIGLVVFGAFLQFLSWRLIFATFIPLGVVAIVLSLPMLRAAARQQRPQVAHGSGPIDWAGSALLFVTALVFVMSSSHLHPGEESYTSTDALSYHIPTHLLFIVLLVGFIVVERRVSNPVVDMAQFRRKGFSLSLGSNVIYHGSMLGTMTLVPILVEEGFGRSPLFVTVVLFPSQALGLFMPMVAGWIYDTYKPQFLRLWAILAIAVGFFGLSQFAPNVSFWALPFIMLPISIGTNVFNPVNNAHIMNSLPLEHRGFASGMLETSREFGHALGATAAAAALGLAIPAGVERLPFEVSRTFFLEGFELSTLIVVGMLLFGALLVYFQKPPSLEPQPEAASGGDG
jgi:MFS family permease